ncbi:DUF4179 domain-containing protein [Anaerovirgula multivorans]|uniref:DUF4179 domain-containing protein n=1 Tax=Anaerovirgula multivorans TaxID=312168 RepID=UPI000B78B97B|nr:DUF4179 domain-containing protein [Anaerovirgula multivorans]
MDLFLISLRKNKGWNSKKIIAAALVDLVVGSTAYIGITNPAYAAGIPIIGDIFRFLDNGRTGVYDLYKENANEINISKESNGIQIRLRMQSLMVKPLPILMKLIPIKI